MKERSVTRKRALKKAREKIKYKKSLHRDIAIFLIKWNMRTCDDPLSEYSRLLGDGFKGFHYMRSRELIRYFEEVYAYIRDTKNPGTAVSEIKNSWGMRSKSMAGLFSERDPEKVLEELRLETDSMMSRLMEIAFDLDSEE